MAKIDAVKEEIKLYQSIRTTFAVIFCALVLWFVVDEDMLIFSVVVGAIMLAATFLISKRIMKKLNELSYIEKEEDN